MSRPPTLLDTVQRLLERTYAMQSGVDEPARFVIGDRGYRLLYGADRDGPGSPHDEGARTLVRETRGGLRACIYYPDALIRQLERYPPQRGLNERNVDAFATLVEELDHLLLLGERARQQRAVSLFELELHANVSKHLVLTRFLAGRAARLDPRRRLWLRHHLFSKVRFCDEDGRVRERYRRAARWAVRLIDHLPRLPPAERLQALRRFHRAHGQAKLSLIRELAG